MTSETRGFPYYICYYSIMSEISFTSDGYKLAGNLFKPVSQPKQFAFLFIQGWTGHQNTEAAQTLTKLGFTTMTYDMRGNGDSEGDITKFSRADFIKDATVAYDYLGSQIGKDTLIGVVGSSFGGYTAVLLSEQRNIFCLSLRVPASYPDEGYYDSLASYAESASTTKWRGKKINFSENHAFQVLHDFKGPVQIIEAGSDNIVPSQSPKNYGDAVADSSRLTYEVVPNAPHRLENEQLQSDYENRLTKWVKNLA